MVSRQDSIESYSLPQRITIWLFGFQNQYEDDLQWQRASALAGMCLTFGFLGFLGTVGLSFFAAQVLPPQLILPNIGMAVGYLFIYWLVRMGRAQIGGVLFLLLALTVPTVQMVAGDVVLVERILLSFSIPIISAALLLGPGWAYVVAILAIGCIGYASYVEYGDLTEQFWVSMSISSFLMLILAFFSWQLTNSLYRWARNAQRRARQLEAAAVVSEVASTAPNLNSLLNIVVERIRDAYGFYHAQVFLIDQSRPETGYDTQTMARLEASTGRAGEALLARGHALPVGSRSVIGRCTLNGTPVVVNDVTKSPTHRPNELLPDTRGELALPLIVGSEVIGALDVQSTEVNAFPPEDVRSLQIMANQLATAIEKAQLVDELQGQAIENQILLEEAQTNLRRIEDLNRRLTREGWGDYLRSRQGILGYTLDHQTGIQQEDTRWSASMRQAYQGEQTVIIRQDQEAHIAAVPLRIRGEVIGVLEVERDGSKPWTEREIEMAETLVDRLALAIENARLFEQATHAVEREHAVNEIAQEVQEAESIDQVLQIALAELGAILGVSRGVVQISPKDDNTLSFK